MSKKESLAGLLEGLSFVQDLAVESTEDGSIIYYRGRTDGKEFSLSYGDDFVYLFIDKDANDELLDAIQQKVGHPDVKASFKNWSFKKQFYYAWAKDETEAEKLFLSLQGAIFAKGLISETFGFGYNNPELLTA